MVSRSQVVDGHPTSNIRDHSFKTLAFFRGRGVKNLPTDSFQKLPKKGGPPWGQKLQKFADVLNG